MPVYDHGRWIGVAMVTISTSSMWQNAPLPARDDPDHTYMLVARQDRSRFDPRPPGSHVVLLHHNLVETSHYTLKPPAISPEVPERTLEELRTHPDLPHDADFHDPVPGFEGRWLAGFAPVGNTGLVMIAETRRDLAIHPSAQLSQRLLQRVSLVILLWGGLFGLGMWTCARKVRPQRPMLV